MRTEETQALLSLLWMLLSDPRMLVLFALLLIASVSDWRSYRIPNWLTFGGALFALLSGVLMARTPGAGAMQALSGLALGFVLLLPCYALGVMGAGDVKLMAMVGAFLGAGATLQAVALSLIAGGVAAIAFALYHRKLARMLGNVKTAVQGMAVAGMAGVAPTASLDQSQSVGKLPYALCISAGTLIQVLAAQLGYA
ncbi:MAG TPA: A24 family peptidase [Variovorax sp.]|nr:A24 family peptidase [Variovorax sp.]